MPYPLKAGYHFHYSRFRRPPYYEMPAAEAYTDFYGISYTICGDNLCYFPDGVSVFQTGDLSLIPQNVYFRTSYLSDMPREEILLKFTGDMISDLLQVLKVDSFDELLGGRELIVHLSGKDQEAVLRIMEEMEREWNSYNQYSEIILKGLLNKLIILCLDRRKDTQKGAAGTRREKKKERLIKAIEYIRSHLAQSPSLEETAGHVRISPSYLSKIFISCLHTPYSVFVVNEKVLYAEKLLVDSDESMAEIAGKAGFPSNTYFSDCFKRMTGMSPLQFRKAYKGTMWNGGFL